MSEIRLLPDDPRLTAYALGELDPSEQIAVERLVAGSPVAQAALGEIRNLAGLLTTELKQEPALALTAAQRTAILEGKVPTVARRHVRSGRANHRWISQFAALATMAAVIAVAAFLPAPGNRSGESQPVEFFAHDRFGERSAGVDLQLAQRGAEFSDFDLMEQPTGELGGEGASLSPTSGAAVSAFNRRLHGKEVLGVVPGGTENLTLQSDGTSIPGQSYEARGIVVDGRARFAGGLAGGLKKNSEVDIKERLAQGREQRAAFQAASGPANSPSDEGKSGSYLAAARRGRFMITSRPPPGCPRRCAVRRPACYLQQVFP
jgi:hypothetical protein